MKNRGHDHQFNAALWSALNPANIKIDERDSRARLAFVANFADLLLYYDQDNQLSDTWQAFFLKDPVILLATISHTDYQGYHAKFSQLEQHWQQAKTAPESAAASPATAHLFLILRNVFQHIEVWFRFMVMDARSYHLYEFLQKKIDNVLMDCLWHLMELRKFLLGSDIGNAALADIDLEWLFKAISRHAQKSHALTSPSISTVSTVNSIAALAFNADNAIGEVCRIFYVVFDVFVHIIEHAHKTFHQLIGQGTRHPDIALLLAFIELLDKQAHALNRLSQKHLDFYYKDVLQQTLFPSRADQVYVCLTLAKNHSSLHLPAGSTFIGGSYPDHTPVLYHSPSEEEINRAAIFAVNTVCYAKPPQDHARFLYVNTIAKPNQLSFTPQQQVNSWDAFGNVSDAPAQQGFALASPILFLQSGLRVITVILVFSGWVKEDYFNASTCYLSTANAWLELGTVNVEQELAEDAVLSACMFKTSPPPPQPLSRQTTLTIQIRLSPSEPAICPFHTNPDAYHSAWPLFKLMLGKHANLNEPPALLSVEFRCDVKQLQQLAMSNAISALPNKGPVFIFGPTPSVNNRYYIGSNECFAKPLQSLSITQYWDNLPSDFSLYYWDYNQFVAAHAAASPAPSSPTPSSPTTSASGTQVNITLTTPSDGAAASNTNLATPFSNTAFHGTWRLLNQNAWSAATPSTTLFQANPQTPSSNNPFSTFSFKFDSTFRPTPELALTALPPVHAAKNGYLSLELSEPSDAFGGELYPKVVTFIALLNAQLLSASIAGKAVTIPYSYAPNTNSAPSPTSTTPPASTQTPPEVFPPIPMANPPYSPKQTALSGSYRAKASTTITEGVKRANEQGAQTVQAGQATYPFELYHYGSFVPYLAYDANAASQNNGFKNLLPQTPAANAANAALPLIAGVTGAGCMMMAFSEVVAPCTLSVLFELTRPGGQAPLMDSDVGFYFWGVNGWWPLTVLEDGSNFLNHAGIIKFAIPASAAILPTMAAPAMPLAAPPPGPLFWIAVVCRQDGASIQLSYINSQAILLSRANMSTLSQGETPYIAANTISAPAQKMPQIASITQAFASFSGNAAESLGSDQRDFYLRVSHRLNHKDRISSRQNYVEMAHDVYAELFYAKTITSQSTRAGKTGSLAAGEVKLGLVKSYANAQLPGAFRPTISSSEIASIQSRIAAKLSAMVSLNVFNLRHQEVSIQCRLIIAPGGNANLLIAQINQHLCLYLSPWINSDMPQTRLNKGINHSALLSFLTSMSNVLAVTELSFLIHPLQAGAASRVAKDSILPEADDTIFVTALQHSIQIAATNSFAPAQPMGQTFDQVAGNGR